MLNDLRLRLRAFFKRAVVDRELDDELRFHVERQIDAYKRAGFDEIEATRRARLQFGGLAQMKEEYRDQRGLPMVETCWRDVTYALRTLRRSPAFTFAAATILALGIGATSAIFSLVDATLLRPLPFRDPDRLVMVWETLPRFSRNRVAPLNFTDWSEQNQTFASMAAAAVGGSVTLSDAQGLPESLPSQTVTGSFFDVLGIRPIAGREFVNDDMRAGANVALMSEGIWRRRFGADPGVVGRAIPMGAQTLTIIGIMPDTFKLFSDADFWLPLGDIPRSPSGRRNHFLLVVGRLRPEATIPSAHADLARVAANIATISPDTNRDVGVHIEPMREALVTGALVPGGLQLTTIVLGGIVALVLLLACANVANLLLARGVSRTREVAVRAALGGSPWRIIQQLLTENLVLAVLGGATGLVLAWVAIRSAPSVLPPRTIPAGVTLRFDGRLTLFATLLTLVTAVIVGLMPAWRASRVPLAEAAAAGGRGSTEHSVALRRALTVIEIAVAVLLTTGAALLVRTLVSLDRVDGGYRGDGVLTAQMGLNFVQYPTSERRFAVLHAIEDEISRVPGVRVAALTTDLPMDGFNMGQFFTIEGDSERDPMRHPAAHYQLITPRLFEALGIPLVRGRPFSDRDTPTSPPVCIVNEEFARRFLSHRDPIGARITVQTVDVPPMTVTREVVGVSRQVKEAPGAQASQLEIYVPVAQNAWYFTTIVARTTGNPWSFVPALKAAVRRVQPDTALLKVRTMDDVASEATSAPRFRARFVAAFAFLAIVLAAGGIFSVFTFTVQQRAREFSIRMALGARSRDVLRLVLADGAKMIAIGLAIGIAGSAALTRSMTSLLFAVTPLDPVAFGGASALLAAIALVACALPAARAAQSDPAVVLREE